MGVGTLAKTNSCIFGVVAICSRLTSGMCSFSADGYYEPFCQKTCKKISRLQLFGLMSDDLLIVTVSFAFVSDCCICSSLLYLHLVFLKTAALNEYLVSQQSHLIP